MAASIALVQLRCDR